MSFTNIYKKLLECNLYHHYFLDDGSTEFDSDPTLKSEQLEKYDHREFIGVLPTERTSQWLNGHKIVFRTTPTGFSLFVRAEETAPDSGIYQPSIEIPQTTTLTFLLAVNDGLFENYSTVVANPEIPFYFSNKQPSSEPGPFSYMDLEITTTNIEDYEILQATYDDLLNDLNVYEPIGLFGIISLEMAGDDTTLVDGNARNILAPGGSLRDPAPVFKIQIKNRSTIWNYRDPSDGSLIHSSDPTELPLVKNGIVGYTFDSLERPSAKPTRLIFEKDGGGSIIKTISEIYIN